jgi:hypothetical protein
MVEDQFVTTGHRHRSPDRLDGSGMSVISSSPEAPSTPADFGNAPTADLQGSA